MIAARCLASLLLLFAAAGCGARGTLTDDEAMPETSTGGSSSSSGGGAVPCGATSCAADAYCFHAWTCSGACSATCSCACGTLPAACNMDTPCFCPGGGYFGAPGEVFGPDAGEPFPGHQVSCYGS